MEYRTTLRDEPEVELPKVGGFLVFLLILLAVSFFAFVKLKQVRGKEDDD